MTVNNDVKKDIYHINDKSYKDLYSNREVFLDLVKGMINAPWSNDLDASDLILVNKSYVSSDYDETESDIVYKANIGETEIIFYVLLEFQSSIDNRMPLRLFFYIAEILKEYSKNAGHKPTDKDIKIPAIIPIVLYNGTKVWDVPTRFRDIVYNSNLFGESIIDFKYDLFDVNNSYSKEELLERKSMTSAIFLLDQKINPLEFLERIKDIALMFDGLTDKELQVLKHWIKNSVEEKLAIKAIEILNSEKGDVRNMVASNAFIITEMEEKAEERAEERKATEIAKNLLDILDDETISLKTGLTIEKVKKLRK